MPLYSAIDVAASRKQQSVFVKWERQNAINAGGISRNAFGMGQRTSKKEVKPKTKRRERFTQLVSRFSLYLSLSLH